MSVLVYSRVELYFNAVIIFNYLFQIPLYFGNIVKTEFCENRCNLEQTDYNCVVLLCNLMKSLLSKEIGIIDRLKLSIFDFNAASY